MVKIVSLSSRLFHFQRLFIYSGGKTTSQCSASVDETHSLIHTSFAVALPLITLYVEEVYVHFCKNLHNTVAVSMLGLTLLF